jgi:hypothetical protein
MKAFKNRGSSIAFVAVLIVCILNHFFVLKEEPPEELLSKSSYIRGHADIRKSGNENKCLRESDQIFVCSTSFGTSFPRFVMLKQILDNLNEVHTSGVQVSIKVYFTSEPPFNTSFSSGMELNFSIADEYGEKNQRKRRKHTKIIQARVKTNRTNFHFSGLCRNDFRRVVESGRFSYILYVENDMNITLGHLENLCKEFKLLEGLTYKNRLIKPGLIRYEGENES